MFVKNGIPQCSKYRFGNQAEALSFTSDFELLIPLTTMTSKNRFKYIFIAIVIVLAGLALADSLGYFNSKSYTAVSHGSHSHYVPHDRDPNVPINDFPQKKPAPGEKITPTGQIVPVEQ